MSSALNDTQIADETEARRSARTVNLMFPITGEAIETLIEQGTTERVLMNDMILLLACGLYTEFADLRSELARFTTSAMLPDGNPNVPAQQRRKDLNRAARYAALAITDLESALSWADKAKKLVAR